MPLCAFFRICSSKVTYSLNKCPKGRADVILYGNREDMAENHHVGTKYLWAGTMSGTMYGDGVIWLLLFFKVKRMRISAYFLKV